MRSGGRSWTLSNGESDNVLRMKLAVIIPALDEAGSIGVVVAHARAAVVADVIVVDNGSQDGTAQVAREAGARVVECGERGYGNACLCGIRAASAADVVVFMDGDGTMSPSDIPSLVAPIAEGRADLVCGARQIQSGTMPPLQAWGNRLSVRLLQLLYGVRLSELGPFRAIRAQTLNAIGMKPSKYAWPAEMLAKAASQKARVVEVPVAYRSRLAGRSKVGGTLRGTVGAGLGIISALIWVWLRARKGVWLRPPVIVGLLASSAFFGLCLARYLSLHSAAYDLGFFDQVVWNVSRGDGLRSSFLEYSFFGQHFEPALLLFVPLYWLAPSPLWLLLGQSLALGLAVVPLHALARDLLGRNAARVAVAAYLLQFGIARAVGFDFHTEALAVPMVFLALWAANQRRWPWFFLFALAPSLTKEDGALLTIGICMLALVVTRRPYPAIGGVAGLGYGLVVVLLVMPVLRQGAPGDLVQRYAYLGATPQQVALQVVTRPDVWLRHLIDSPAPLALLAMLAAVGLLPLFRPLTLPAVVLPLLPALLSADQLQAGLRLHYAIGGVPLLIVAALLGWQRIPPRTGAALLFAGSIATWILLAPTLNDLAKQVPQIYRAASVHALLQRIPSSATVSASTGLVPQLSERAHIHEFPGGWSADWIALDNLNPPSAQSTVKGYDRLREGLPAAGSQIEGRTAGVTLWRKAGVP